MSVCISLLAEHGKKVINISDRKVNFGAFSADNLALKDYPLYRDIYALFAGNDVEHVEPILNRAREILYELKSPPSVVQAARILDQAYGERVNEEITCRVLRKRGFTVDSFLEKGRQKCTPSAYLNLCNRIDQVSISLRFIVSGFGSESTGELASARIYVVDGKNAPKSYTSVGMWAIGTGASAALSSLAFHAERLDVNSFASEGVALYFGLAAKFAAESSAEVGRGDTFAYIAERGKRIRYPVYALIQSVRAKWEKEGAARIPKNLEAEMKELVAKETKEP
jgi:hypothetical protein